MPKGFFDKTIREVQEELGVEEHISSETVRSRIKRKNITGINDCNFSPIAAAEKYIAETIIQMAKIKRPLSVSACIQLANSMITGTTHQKKLVEFKKKRKFDETNGLGSAWFKGFCKRNPAVITRKAVKFSINRSQWCNQENFQIMYDSIYEELHEAGLATKHENDGVWKNLAGELVDSLQAVGRKCQYHLTHPEYLLFVDEVGSNTNMTSDKNKGGEQFACERGTVPRQQASNTDIHFTVLGFTNAAGQAVLCGIIIGGSTLSADQILGFDVLAGTEDEIEKAANLLNSDNDAFIQNMTTSHMFPGGPTCHVGDKVIPPFITCSPSGGITSQILADMMQWLDRHLQLPRHPGCPTPCILLDGHGSRLEIPFLTYVSNPEHRWNPLIGCPNGTSLWQVGDSVEQNGCFKMHQYDVKTKILNKKRELGLIDTNLKRTDIVPIVNYCWERSFQRTESNKKAIAMRGWNPLNYILLDSPEVASKEVVPPSPHPPPIVTVNTDEDTTLSSLSNNDIDINFRDGLAGHCVLSLLQQAAKDKECMENLQKRKESNKTFFDHMKESKRLTAGVVFNAGCVNLVKGGLLDIVKQNHKTKNKEMLQKLEKEVDRYNKRMSKAITTLHKYQTKLTNLRGPEDIPEDQLTQEDLKVFIMARKRRLDKALPKTVEELRQRWKDVKVLSVMNSYEHLLDHGFSRDLIDIYMSSQQEATTVPRDGNPDNTNNPLHLLAHTAAL